MGAGSAATKKRWDGHDVEGKWDNSVFAKNKAKVQRRKELSDFERFKVMVLRKQVRPYHQPGCETCAVPRLPRRCRQRDGPEHLLTERIGSF